MSTVTVLISKYEEKTQLYLEKPPRSEAIEGIAVVTIVASTAPTNIASMTEMSTSGRFVILLFFTVFILLSNEQKRKRLFRGAESGRGISSFVGYPQAEYFIVPKYRKGPHLGARN